MHVEVKFLPISIKQLRFSSDLKNSEVIPNFVIWVPPSVLISPPQIKSYYFSLDNIIGPHCEEVTVYFLNLIKFIKVLANFQLKTHWNFGTIHKSCY